MQSNVSLIITWLGDRLVAEPAPTETPTEIDASETDFVELGLCIHAAGIYPTLTQEAIMGWMRQFSGLPLQNWEQLAANIRRRGSLKFIDRLGDSLMERNEEIKENGRANRRPKSRKNNF
jgi:hypothetical protein